MLRWLFRNTSALLLSLALAVTIWVVAVTEEDPFDEKPFPDPVSITISGLPDGMMIVGNPRLTATLQVRAPRSVWASLNANQLHVNADLANATNGTITVPLTAAVDNRAAHITNIAPAEIQLTLEQIVSRQVPVRVEVAGAPATGYQARDAEVAVENATLSGPLSAADSVSEVVARINVDGARQSIDEVVALTAVDVSGRPVTGVTLTPDTVEVTVPVEQLGGYRDVAVKVVITGQVAAGFRLTNITVSPPVITLFSSDPNVVAELAGFVETEPINIDSARDDIEVRAALNLPENVSLPEDQTVLVQVNIAAIESSLTIQRELEIQGLGPGLSAFPSPTTVDVILSGPLPTLDSLTPESVRVVLNLLNLTPGPHQVTPEVIVLPEGVTVQTVLPATIEVLIIGPGTPTPILTHTPTPFPTPLPTRPRPRTSTPTSTMTPTLEATPTP